jgi:pimeloyl-ACP methyl ester carboxylesterase
VFATVTLGDGRSLEYVELGDPSGRPVLFCHGTPATGGQAAVVADAARDHGVRLLAPSRPGYGDSTASAPGLASFAADALELADLVGLDRFTTMGLSGGGPFALAVAAVAPERVTSVAVQGGTAAYFEVMPPSDDDAAERRAMAMFLAGDHDEAVAELTRSAEAELGPLRGLSEDEFAAAMRAQAPPNESWLADRPVAYAAFLADFRRAIAGPSGYVRDNLSWGSGWDVDLGAVTAPVHLAYGDHDRMVSRQHGDWLLERLPGADLVLVPGGHGDATFGQCEETFRRIAASPGQADHPAR